MIRNVSDGFNCPFLSLGGAGNWQHISELFLTTEVSLLAHKIYFTLQKKVLIQLRIFKNKKN